MLKIVLIVVVVVVAALSAVLAYGVFRWSSDTRDLRARIEDAHMPVESWTVDFGELDGLPAPVERYFRAVLKEGQPVVTHVRVKHQGTFNLGGEEADQWRPFTSDQVVVTRRPGFDWDGRIRMMPGLTVRVHDAYVAGDGLLHASLFGLFSLAEMRGTGDLAKGELMRFFAESAWYPTALLPSQRVQWEAVDDRSARGTLTDGAISVTMLFTFNELGLINTVLADARGRAVGDDVVPTPWRGRFWNHGERAGMLVPLDGEVEWLLPDGAKPYWRGRITEIEYEF